MSNEAECVFLDQKSAYRALMPFIQDNAVFIPIDATEDYQLGEQIQVSLKLPELGESVIFRGSIVWLSFESPPNKQGVGVRFEGVEGHRAKELLESYTQDVSFDGLTDTI
ncbi:PilZ domain-containing protein [Thiotrichales bacterium 19S9-12]|nr:PilZ domain-containing protein [Thiotrichales bacterium 19S9-11]MCF6812251.1 PilZ domain-containing protein [Thiotrichales bacterium 19S9-12]